jgi:hypothetical protein
MSSTNKPSNTEDEYFAREEAARLRNLATEKSRTLQADEAEQLKKLHWMHCPKCGMNLDTIAFRGLTIDKCFHCGGTWLDAGELEQLAGKEHGFLDTVLSVFRHKEKPAK